MVWNWKFSYKIRVTRRWHSSTWGLVWIKWNNDTTQKECLHLLWLFGRSRRSIRDARDCLLDLTYNYHGTFWWWAWVVFDREHFQAWNQKLLAWQKKSTQKETSKIQSKLILYVLTKQEKEDPDQDCQLANRDTAWYRTFYQVITYWNT